VVLVLVLLLCGSGSACFVLGCALLVEIAALSLAMTAKKNIPASQ
jgi:hypothetical protein